MPPQLVMIVRPSPCGCWEVVGNSGPAGVLLSLDAAMDSALDWARHSGGRIELSLSPGVQTSQAELRAA